MNQLLCLKAKSIVAFLLLIATCIDCTLAQSPPLVSNVSGTVSNGATITVDGSNFGSTGPQVLLFDDFEGGDPPNPIRTGPGSAVIGQWGSLNTNNPDYTSATSVSGSKAFQAVPALSYAEVLIPVPDTLEVFVSYWRYIGANEYWPGELNTAEGINWKIIWIMGSGTNDDDITLPTQLGTTNCAVVHNDGVYTGWPGCSFVRGQWQRVWAWVKGSYGTDGQVHYWELSPSGVQQELNANNVQVQNGPEQGLTPGPVMYERIRLNGYGRDTENSHPTFDDVYFAIGPNARARIEIGNRSTYSSCTKLTLATPTQWSSNQIQATVRQGQFTSDESAYLYVINGSGATNAIGYPVTFSGSGADASPNAPSGLRISP